MGGLKDEVGAVDFHKRRWEQLSTPEHLP